MLGIFGINHVTRIKLWWKKNYNICSMYWCMDRESRLWIKDEWFLITDCTNHSSRGHGFLSSLNTNMWIMNPADRVWSDAVAGMDSWWLDNTGAAGCSRRYRDNRTQTCQGRNHHLYCIWIAKCSYTFSTKKWNHKTCVSIPQFDVNKIITTLFYLFNIII